MELKCANCGHSLPSEDAKYCNNCGTLTPAHPFSPHARARTSAPSSEEKSSPTPVQEDDEPSAARKDDPPLWMSNLEKSVEGARSSMPQSRPAHGESASSRQQSSEQKTNRGEARPAAARSRQRSTADFSWPEPVTHMVAKDSPSTNDQAQDQFSFEDFSPVPKPSPAGASEFRVKVWDQDEAPQEDEIENLPTQALEAEEIRKAEAHQSEEKEAIEHLPTQALEAEEIRKERQKQESRERQRRQDFEMLETTPLAAQPSSQKKGPKAPSEADDFTKPDWDENAFPVVERGNSPRTQYDPSLKPERGNSARPSQSPANATPFLGLDNHPPTETPRPFQDQDRTFRPDPTATPFLGLAANEQFPTEKAPSTPQPTPDWQNYSAFASPSTPSPAQPVASQRKRLRFGTIIAGVLAVVVLGGLAFWLIAGHPFQQNVQAWQTYSNESLKVSMELPDDWTSKNQPNQTVFLADSTNTGLIDISVSNDAPSDLAKYLTQQATKLSMDNITPSESISFAGAQWTQLHGTIDVKSASYTDVLLATNHNGHLYLLSFKAPQKSYSDFEKATFSHVRSTFKFL